MANNSSLLSHAPPASTGWGAVELCNILTASIGGFLNVSVGIIFLTNRAFMTPFTIYLMNLLVFNFMETALAKMAEALLVVSPGFRSSYAACGFYLFSTFLAGAGMINTHVLISFNRLWAVIFPHSYKMHHTKSMAVAICTGMWLYILATVLPMLIRDTLLFRIPVNVSGRCAVNNRAQPTLCLTTLIVVYVVPEVIILVTFPIIWRKRKAFRRTAQGVTIVVPNTQQEVTGVQTNASVKEMPKQQSKSMQVFVALIGSMLICWTPLTTAMVLGYSMIPVNRIYFGIASFLFAVQGITDPLLFGLMFGNLSKRMCCTKRQTKLK